MTPLIEFSERPIVYLIANFITGFLVSSGVVESHQATELANTITSLVGAAILFMTSLVAIYRIVKHKGSLFTPPTIQNAIIIDPPPQVYPVTSKNQPIEETPLKTDDTAKNERG